MPKAAREDQLKNEWELDVIPGLFGGINTSVPATLIDPSEVPVAQGVSFTEGRVRVDTGYVKLGQTLRGAPQAFYQHQTASGNLELLAVTRATVYRYVPGVPEWQYISDGTETTVAGAQTAPDTLIDVADTAGFSIGDYIGIKYPDGTEHKTTIAAIPTPGAPGVIQIADATTKDLNGGEDFYKAKDLSGSSNGQVVILGVPFADWTVFTNGVDPPQRYDPDAGAAGGTVETIPNVTSAATSCITMALYKNHLVLGNVVVGGARQIDTVVWCADGDLTDWTGGDSGSNPLSDTRDPIQAMLPLGDSLIIYRSQSIARAEHIQDPLIPFAFKQLIYGESEGSQGVGARSPRSVVSQGDRHLVLSTDGVYEYRGGFSVRFLSGKIYPTAFGGQSNLNYEILETSFIVYGPGMRELLVFLPTTISQNYPKSFYSLDLQNGTWRYRPLFVEVSTASPFVPEFGLRIIDLVGTIAQQTWRIGSGAGSTGRASVVFGGPDAQPYNYDYQSTTDDGSSIPFILYTKEFKSSGIERRFSFVEVEHKGPNINLYLIEEGGGAYLLGTLPESTGMRRSRIYLNRTAEMVQFLFAASQPGVEIGHITVKSKEASRWTLYGSTSTT